MGFQKPFDKADYANRVARVKSRMQPSGFDLIICQNPANMCYLSGFDGWSFYTPQCLLVHLDEDMPIWFGAAVSEPFVVTENGGERLCDVYRELIVID